MGERTELDIYAGRLWLVETTNADRGHDPAFDRPWHATLRVTDFEDEPLPFSADELRSLAADLVAAAERLDALNADKEPPADG